MLFKIMENLSEAIGPENFYAILQSISDNLSQPEADQLRKLGHEYQELYSFADDYERAFREFGSGR